MALRLSDLHTSFGIEARWVGFTEQPESVGWRFAYPTYTLLLASRPGGSVLPNNRKTSDEASLIRPTHIFRHRGPVGRFYRTTGKRRMALCLSDLHTSFGIEARLFGTAAQPELSDGATLIRPTYIFWHRGPVGRFYRTAGKRRMTLRLSDLHISSGIEARWVGLPNNRNTSGGASLIRPTKATNL